MRLDNWFITNPDILQQEVLKVPINQNLIVKGVAGSGKTNMAIYRANQSGDATFVIVVYTVALKKMIRYGLTELGLDKDRVVHAWSWINRGIEISGDLFCLKGDNKFFLNQNLLILKSENNVRFFVLKGAFDKIKETRTILGNDVQFLENPLEVSIDFDDWVEDMFYYTFYRRKRWFFEVKINDFKFNISDKRSVFIPSGFLYKDEGVVDHLIVDEGQDFSILDYENNFISKKRKSITIFGDTTQQLYSKLGTSGASVDNIIDRFKFPSLELAYNYRIPKTIARIAQNIPNKPLDLLTNNRKNNGNSDYPLFPKPIVKKCKSEDDELLFIIKRIELEGLDDVGILLPNNNKIEKVRKLFSDRDIGTQVRYTVDLPENIKAGIFPRFKVVDTLDFTNQDLPCILTYHSAKGTEFDNVFIPFADDDNKIDRNSFYVAITRSSSRVFITYSRKITSLLKNVNVNDIINQ